MRMAQTGYGFIIVAAPGMDGRTLMVASQCVRHVEINHQQHNINHWGGNMVADYRETEIVARLGSHDQQMVQLNVEEGGYAEAWRRLFDLWVPPQFTDETKSQILTHYTFNAPDQTPPPSRYRGFSIGMQSGLRMQAAPPAPGMQS